MVDTTTLEKPEITIAVEDFSAIANLRYQPETQKLFVQFQSGEKEYPHYNVPPQVFEEFAAADSKGKFFHAEIKDQYPPTPEQAFREELKTTLEAAGIDSTQSVKIQAGRDVIFKGNLDSPDVNKLSLSRLASLNAALDIAENGAESKAEPVKGVVNIDVGDSRVFRMAKGKVEINNLQPVRTEQQVQTQLDLAESLDVVTGPILERSGETLKQLLEDKGVPEDFYTDNDTDAGFDSYRIAFYATCDWVATEAKTDPGIQTFLQQFPGKLDMVAGRLLERQFDPDWEPSFPDPQPSPSTTQVQESPVETVSASQSSVSSPEPETAQEVAPTAAIASEPAPPPQPFNPAIAKQELKEFDQRLNPTQPNRMQAMAAKAAQVAGALPEKLTVPAAATALKELYSSNLSNTAQQWAGTALKKLHQVAGMVPEDLTERSLKATGKAISQIAAIPEELRKRQMADAVVKLAKTFGGLQEEGDRKVFGMDAENYKIQVRHTNQYSVSNAAGKEILSFTQTKFGPKFSQCDPNALEQRDLLRAGKQVTPELARQPAEMIAAKLGNLAPAGTRAEAREQQESRIKERVNQKLDKAVAQGKTSVEGEHYRLEQHSDGSRSLTAHQSKEPSLTITADGKVTSHLQADDRERLLQKPQQQKAQERKREAVGMEA